MVRFAIIPWFDTQEKVWGESLKIIGDWGEMAQINGMEDGRLEILCCGAGAEMAVEQIPPNYMCSNDRAILTFTPPPWVEELQRAEVRLAQRRKKS